MEEVFRALGDATRRTILDELAERDGQTQFELCRRLLVRHGIESSRQAIAQHLAVLEAAGIVSIVRDGRTKRHFLRTEPIHAALRRWPPPDDGAPT